jgi:hypothetical protein
MEEVRPLFSQALGLLLTRTAGTVEGRSHARNAD